VTVAGSYLGQFKLKCCNKSSDWWIKMSDYFTVKYLSVS